ncbi:5-oxoprolinase subunit PxpA [Luteimonas abyssi]|uniref:5-oxoprolinase subunit PxpA n=1 Tax=Luteimonas abyssi TaxID=1247514 RepID=UPI000737C510|nr:5-oxoprolinase subunit PxpA [Luteimonas abyssi]
MNDAIDFNCDLGEGCGDDAAIVPCISSASIACGGHAGDPASMREAIALCLRHGVAIGAHPAFEDRAHFGRRELPLTPAQAHALIGRQLAPMAAACAEAGTRLAHVKPHGALYNLAARETAIADAVATAVHAFDPDLWLYALAGSALAAAGRRHGLAVAEEVFAERGYTAAGQLVARGQPGAIVDTLPDALAQVRSMLRDGTVTAVDGQRVALRADTLCLHGDRPDAAVFAAALREALLADGHRIVAPTRPDHPA